MVFKTHFTKVCNNEGIVTHARCNYCGVEFKRNKGGGYDTFNKHGEETPNKIGHPRTQSQIRSW